MTAGETRPTVIHPPRGARREVAWAVVIALVLLVLAASWAFRSAPNSAPLASPATLAVTPKPTAARPVVETVATATPDASFSTSPVAGSADPNDLANYLRPGDPEPSMLAVITALRQSGINEGLAAFNPPGTSPSLEGLAVPDDFILPPGYVRHHQVSDSGELIEPILMFAPDAVFRDAQGRPIALPADGVVPPELAPPGLPLRWVVPGKP